MKHIWKLIVKDTVKDRKIIRSTDNWTREYWCDNGDYCYIINSGSEVVFSFTKIYVNKGKRWTI